MTIMLVDDDRDFLEMYRSLLSARGYRVVCFSDHQRAWASLEEDLPDLVVTDLMMLELDSGFSLARRIKAEPRTSRVPVIIVTAVGSQLGFDFVPREGRDLESMGADAFLEKPVSPQEMIRRVEELLGR